MTSLQQAKLIARFLHLKRRPTENRQFYEYFFDQQEKANSIDQLVKLRNVIDSVKVAQERSKGPGARRNAASQFSSYDSAQSSQKGRQSPADDLLQLPKSSEITFTNREKTQILTKLKEEYRDRQAATLMRKKYNKDTPTVKNTKEDIKQFIKDSHGKNAEYQYNEVK